MVSLWLKIVVVQSSYFDSASKLKQVYLSNETTDFMSNETTDFLFGLMPRIEHIVIKNGMLWFTLKYSIDL